jgi:hypothetical protein
MHTKTAQVDSTRLTLFPLGKDNFYHRDGMKCDSLVGAGLSCILTCLEFPTGDNSVRMNMGILYITLPGLFFQI